MLNLHDVNYKTKWQPTQKLGTTARPPSFSKENDSIAAGADSVCRSESDIRGAEQRALSATDWTLHGDTLHTGRYHLQWLQGHSAIMHVFLVTGLKESTWLHFYYVHGRVLSLDQRYSAKVIVTVQLRKMSCL